METERITFEPTRLCRACGAKSLHMCPLSARDSDAGFRLDDMLMACTDLKIHVGDGLPSSICYSCADELKTSYRFKQRCETTDRYFNELRLKSNEIKQEQETVVFKEGENENLLELKEEKDTNDNSSSLSFEEVAEGIPEVVVISREIKQEQGDPLAIIETIICKQEANFSDVTEDEAVRVSNLDDSPLNEDFCFEDFPNKKENRNLVSEKSENEGFPSGSKEQNEEGTIHDGSSEASCSSKDDNSDYFLKDELRKTNQLGHFESNIRGEYSLSSNLRLHKQTHENAGRKRFQCDVCEKTFSTNTYLRDHKKMHENGEQKCYKCNVCEKSFVTKWNLRTHKLRHENGRQKCFKCDVCTKSFYTSWYLREHQQIHVNGGRKSFKCDICAKSFTTSKYLREHKRRHENGGRKSFQCDICEKSFATSRNLQAHKLRHENGRLECFKCDVCEKSFLTSWILREHKLWHENGRRKSFKCDVCEKSYTQSRFLQEHKWRHENAERKYFKCDICEKLFATSWYLQEHKKTHKNNILYERK